MISTATRRYFQLIEGHAADLNFKPDPGLNGCLTYHGSTGWTALLQLGEDAPDEVKVIVLSWIDCASDPDADPRIVSTRVGEDVPIATVLSWLCEALDVVEPDPLVRRGSVIDG